MTVYIMWLWMMVSMHSVLPKQLSPSLLLRPSDLGIYHSTSCLRHSSLQKWRWNLRHPSQRKVLPSVNTWQTLTANLSAITLPQCDLKAYIQQDLGLTYKWPLSTVWEGNVHVAYITISEHLISKEFSGEACLQTLLVCLCTHTYELNIHVTLLLQILATALNEAMNTQAHSNKVLHMWDYIRTMLVPSLPTPSLSHDH